MNWGHQRNTSLTRRGTLALAAGLLTSGCIARPNTESTKRRPVLVSPLVVANDTDQGHEYQLQVQYTSNPETSPELVYQTAGTVQARNQATIEGDWPHEPGRFVVAISVDNGDWSKQDLTDRFTQEERICYRQELSINEDGVDFMTNLDAPCPDL